jgi:hypothetical protein
MGNSRSFNTSRLNLEDYINQLIEKDDNPVRFYNVITGQEYKLLGLGISIDLDEPVIKALNLNKNKKENIPFSQFHNLEQITEE